MATLMAEKTAAHLNGPTLEGFGAQLMHPSPCVDGLTADFFPCSGVDLHGYLNLTELGCAVEPCYGSDLWGWVDNETGKEYALMTVIDGVSVVDVTDSVAPLPVAFVPTATSWWHDVKVYADHMFHVSEGNESWGVQVFDLTRVRGLTTLTTMEADANFTDGGNLISAHNLFINEERGVAYILGSNLCAGGLYMVNVRDPTEPEYWGCYWEDGYTHDAQCVVYAGPDTARHGRDICFAYNEDTLTIVDVTNATAPVLLSRTAYNGSAYTHQGWLTPDMKYVLLDDEMDELLALHYNVSDVRTTTFIVDCSDLAAPVFVDVFQSETSAIDHNLYVTEDWFAFQSNYAAGLRILDVLDMQHIYESAFFDVFPYWDQGFYGTWSNYPFFPSGNVPVSTLHLGLFIVKPTNLTREGSTTSPTPLVTSPTSSTSSPTPSPTSFPTVVLETTSSAADDTSVANLHTPCLFLRFTLNVCVLFPTRLL